MPPNRAVHEGTLCGRDIHIPKGVYCLLVLDREKFTRFQIAKTSANKRFLICLQSRGAAVQYCSTSFRVVQYCSFTPSLRCKGSELFWIEQEKSLFGRFFVLRTALCAYYLEFRKMGNLNKKHFLVTGSWVGVLSEFSRSSVGGIRQGIREGKEMEILRKSTFW